MNHYITKFLIGFALLLASITVRAMPVAAIDFDSFDAASSPAITSNFGWMFSTNNAFNVTDLGYYDLNQDGLNASHQVGIWSSDGVLLTSAVVSPEDALIGDFRYVGIMDLLLEAGETYVIGALAGNGDAAVAVGDNPFTAVADINFITGLASLAVILDFPTIPAGLDPSTFGPNFLLQSISPIPVPAALWLFATALLGMLGLSRRNKSRST